MAALVSYTRGERRLDPPDAVIDALLLKAFPGRTLDELDDMDWGRWQRAQAAQMHMDIEHLRRKLLDGDMKSDDLPDGVSALIVEHDALLEDDDDGA